MFPLGSLILYDHLDALMEYSFFSKEKETNYWACTHPGDPNGETRNSNDDSFVNFSEMMISDGYAGWGSNPASTGQLLASYGFPSFPSMPPNYGSYDHMSFPEQSNSLFPMSDNSSCPNVLGSPLGFHDLQFGFPIGFSDENYSSAKKDNISLLLQGRVPQSIGHSLSERMLRALSLFKESSRGGILAQVWVPVRDGGNYVLSTCEQPYLLDQMLLGYREVSRSYTFSAERKPGSFPGLPGRVFLSKFPEWTSDVNYYHSAEYLRVKHARDHEVRGSVAIPIFSSAEMSCCAVLELVTVKEKPNFDDEMEAVCHALEAVDLRTTSLPRLLPQGLSLNQRSVLAEITDVLRAVSHAHRLPLALTWIPCTLEEYDDKIIRLQVTNFSSNLNSKLVLCIEESACYVNDKEMLGFVHACREHPLEEGQGLAGKALQSNLPSFSRDVKTYHINDYPLVQHARKFSLNAAVAIRLRSTYTENDDYILEFFLPLNMKGTKEQQLLLDSLSCTMQRICRSLRTVADAELDGSVNSKVEERGASLSFFPRDVPTMSSQQVVARSNLNEVDPMSLYVPFMKNDSIAAGDSSVQACVSIRQTEKKRSTAEKTVSLSILQQYFSGSLKDAAKSLGVCPTTLKRICRQHGISRWPSRKINKVNRSLKKIQTVLDSVEGVEGRLKFDPRTGELDASSSVIQESKASKTLFLPNKTSSAKNELSPSSSLNAEVSAVKLEKDSYLTQNQLNPVLTMLGSLNGKEEPWKCAENVKLQNQWVVEHNQPSTSSMTTDSSNGSGSMSSAPDGRSKNKTVLEDGGSRIITVKATYKEDTIRFKFYPSSGCLHLYEEIATRFKIQLGTFQLKYLDDEEEWVMLVSDSDLLECLEIMEFVGKQSIKFLVRDLPCGMGSSSSSNCCLVRSSEPSLA